MTGAAQVGVEAVAGARSQVFALPAGNQPYLAAAAATARSP
jgi:hypothetical protein